MGWFSLGPRIHRHSIPSCQAKIIVLVMPIFFIRWFLISIRISPYPCWPTSFNAASNCCLDMPSVLVAFGADPVPFVKGFSIFNSGPAGRHPPTNRKFPIGTGNSGWAGVPGKRWFRGCKACGLIGPGSTWGGPSIPNPIVGWHGQGPFGSCGRGFLPGHPFSGCMVSPWDSGGAVFSGVFSA